MAFPYSFPYNRAQFDAVVVPANSSTCDGLIKSILRLPLMIFQTIRNIIDENGELTATFLSMIYTPGEMKVSAVPLGGFQKGCWLLCDGSSYSITQYPDLATALGATGSSAGVFGTQTNPNILDSTGAVVPVPAVSPGLFRVPDMRGMAAVGIAARGQTFSIPYGATISIGSAFGEPAHQLVPGEDPPHRHFIAYDYGATAGFSGGTQDNPTGPSGSMPADAGALSSVNVLVQAASQLNSLGYSLCGAPDYDANHGMTSISGGVQVSQSNIGAIPFTLGTLTNYYAAKPHNNLPPSMGLYYYIFAGVPVTANTTSTDETLTPI